MGLCLHLTKDTLGNIVIATPIGGSFGILKLVHKHAALIHSQLLSRIMHLSSTINKVAMPTKSFNQGNLLSRSRLWHYSIKVHAN